MVKVYILNPDNNKIVVEKVLTKEAAIIVLKHYKISSLNRKEIVKTKRLIKK